MSIWYTSENSSAEKPAEIDKTSSKVFNYIRKDFVEIPAQESEGEEDMFFPGFGSAHWQYQEAKIRKKDWDNFVRSDVRYYLANQRYEKGIKEPPVVVAETTNGDDAPEIVPDMFPDGMLNENGIVFDEP